MSKHVAYFADPEHFEQVEVIDYAPGIRVRKGSRPGSKTREGFAYEFEAAQFSDAEAMDWLRGKSIRATRFDLSSEEPAFGQLEMEALEEGEHTDKNGRVLKATREYIAQLAANTTRLIREGKLKPPVKLGHDPDQSSVQRMFPEGGEPALGYLTEAMVRGNRIAVRAAHVPRKFVQAVKDKLWSKTSAEIHPNYRGEGPAIVGIACLGATRPAIPQLADIIGFEAAALETTFTSLQLFEEDAPCFLFTEEPPDSEEADSAPGGPDAQDGEDEKKTNQETQDPPKEDETMSDELKAKVAELEAQNKSQLEAAKKAIADTLEFCVGDTITPAQLEDEKKIAMQFSTPEQVSNYVASVRKRAKVKDDTKPIGSTEHKPKVEGPAALRAQQIWEFSETRRQMDGGRAYVQDGATDVAGMAICPEEAEFMALCEQQQQLMKCSYAKADETVRSMRPDLVKKIRDARWGGV